MEPAGGTTLVLGGACVVGLEGVLATASIELDRLGITAAVDVVINFCRNLIYYSVEGFVGRGIEEALRDLVRFTANPNVPNFLPEFRQRILDLARQITGAGR